MTPDEYTLGTTNTCAQIQIPPDAVAELAAVSRMLARLEKTHDISGIGEAIRERLGVLIGFNPESGIIVDIILGALKVAEISCFEDGK